MRRFIGFLAVALLAATISVPSSSAQEALTDEEAWAFMLFALSGGNIDDYEENSMIDGSALESGLAKLVGVGQVLFDAPPSEVYPILRRALAVDVRSEGDPSFDNTVGQTHVWLAKFTEPLSGNGEAGVALRDAGAPLLAHPDLKSAPTNGSSRQAALIFGVQQGSVYAVANEAQELDLFASPFFVGAALLPSGEWLLIFAGPFSPEWSFYISGSTKTPTDPEFVASLAGYGTPYMQPALEQTPSAVVEQALAEDPETTALASFMVTGDYVDPEVGTVGESQEPPVADDEPNASTDQPTADESVGDEAVGDEATGVGESSGGSSALLLIGAFLLAIFVMLLMFSFWGRRPKRQSPASTDSKKPGPDPTPQEGGRLRPTGGYVPAEGSTPEKSDPPVGVPAMPTECDWELRVKTRAASNTLRPAAAGRTVCCVYTVELATEIEVDNSHTYIAPGLSNDRVPTIASDMTAVGLDVVAQASAGTETAGRRSEITRLAEEPNTPILLEPLGDVPPDVAAHVGRDETTTLTVTLVSQCLDPRGEFSGSVTSNLDARPGAECTNTDTADGCSVRVVAVGRQAILVSEDLTLDVRQGFGGLVDDSAPPDQRRPGSHDHDDGTVWTSQLRQSGSDDRDTGAMKWSVKLNTVMGFDAGQIVPDDARPTTDRVIAAVEGSVLTRLELDAKMTNGCGPTGCACTPGGNHVCHCDPDFTLVIDGANSSITADNQNWAISREADNGSGKRLVDWRIG